MGREYSIKDIETNALPFGNKQCYILTSYHTQYNSMWTKMVTVKKVNRTWLLYYVCIFIFRLKAVYSNGPSFPQMEDKELGEDDF